MKRHSSFLCPVLGMLCLGFFGTNLVAQDYPEVKATEVVSGLYMLSAKGGNIGVLIGEDGTFMIDDQFSNGTDEIFAAIKKVGGDTPRFLINTHFHGDHTGGNENIGDKGVLIYSHHNVRKRLTTENFIREFNFTMPAVKQPGLPVVTFSQDITFHLNGGEVHVFHVENAHTDGDAVIHFKSMNAVHAGDIFFNGFYPFVDPSHGGSVKGMINAVDRILAITNDDTMIIPGHGPLASKADLREYREMLSTAYKRIGKLKREGNSVQQIIDANPLGDLQEKWGNVMFDSSKWISIIFPIVN